MTGLAIAFACGVVINALVAFLNGRTSGQNLATLKQIRGMIQTLDAWAAAQQASGEAMIRLMREHTDLAREETLRLQAHRDLLQDLLDDEKRIVRIPPQ